MPLKFKEDGTLDSLIVRKVRTHNIENRYCVLEVVCSDGKILQLQLSKFVTKNVSRTLKELSAIFSNVDKVDDLKILAET